MPSNQPGVPQKSPFLGPAYAAHSAELSLQQCINLYPEVIIRETPRGTTKEVGAFYACPGMTTPLVTLGASPGRPGGLWVQGNTLYAVAADKLYTVDGAFSATLRGTIGSSSGLVSIVSNNTQTGVFDGTANCYVWNGAAFSTVALPSAAAATCAVTLNGFALCNQVNSINLWQSNLNDMTTWSALNFAQADATPDLVQGLATLHNQVFVFKSTHIEVWYNAGNSGFAFQRLAGVLPNIGVSGAATIANLRDSIIWLGNDQNGLGAVYQMSGYEPRRVSTYAIEQAINGYNTSGVFAWVYSQAGHDFYVLTFPTAGVTWCLDLSASATMGFPIWHQRASWDGASFGAHAVGSAALWTGKIVVNNRNSGALHKLDTATNTDNGSARKWLRSWRSDPNFDPSTNALRCLEIEYDDSVSGTFSLRQSFNGGQNWSSPALTAAYGAGIRARFRRLGMTDRGAISDRILELSSTDPVAGLMNAWTS